MFRSASGVMSAALLLAALAGCASTTEPVATTEPRPEAQPAPAPRTTQADGRMKSSYAFPTGHVDTSVLLLERDLPAEIVSGQEFWYDLKVTNVNHIQIKGVTVRDDCASALTLTRAEPAPVGQKPPFMWSLGDMNPGESRTIRVTGKVAGTDPFTSCASATYNSSLCLTAPVVSPALKLTLAAPAEATPCDNLPVRMTVTNTGTGAARDVRLSYPLPEGWTTTDGKNTAQFAIETLAAGKAQDFLVNAKSVRTGDFTSRASVTATPGLKAEASPAATAIRQAVLNVKAEGPEQVFGGRPATFKFTVSNTGTAPAMQGILEAPVPAGAKFVSAGEGGLLRGGVVAWTLPTLPVKASHTYSMTVEPAAIGELDGTATAKAYCATPAKDVASVLVLGIPALLLEVTDLADPIEVGRDTTYEIVITNQGSAAATNVKIAAMLEANEQFLSAAGGMAKAAGNAITFEPIATIAPKAKATLKVTVKAASEGDTRFKVTMTSDQLKRPVEETESTTIYR